jgi:hypothetical protein
VPEFTFSVSSAGAVIVGFSVSASHGTVEKGLNK